MNNMVKFFNKKKNAIIQEKEYNIKNKAKI